MRAPEGARFNVDRLGRDVEPCGLSVGQKDAFMAGEASPHGALSDRADPDDKRPRFAYIDAARGVGIILVVIAHCLRGLVDAGILMDGAVVRLIDDLIYAFHMPLFFLLSGMLYERSALAMPFGTFLLSRIERLIWPLILWTWLFFGFRAAAGELVNSPAAWTDFPLVPLPPLLHFWFLWALFVISVLVHALRPLLFRRTGSLAFWAAILIASITLDLWRPMPPEFAVWLIAAYLYAPCFIAGLLLARVFAVAGAGATTNPGFVLAVTAIGIAVLATLFRAEGPTWPLFVALVVPVALVILIRALQQWHLPFGVLTDLGQGAMAIFLAHTIFSSAFRIALTQAGVQDGTLHVVGGTLVGLAGPMALRAVARLLGATRLLGF